MANDKTAASPVLVLFREDLRIADNRAVHAAGESGKPIIALFILDEKAGRPRGGARRWWLHHSLERLADDLATYDVSLHLRRGRTQEVVDEFIAASGADMVLWNRRYAPDAVKVDAQLKKALQERRIAAESFDGQLLHEPSRLKTKSGGFYKVYTPFRRALNAMPEPRDPLPRPQTLTPYRIRIASDKLSDWGLLPRKPDWSGGIAAHWEPGENAARQHLDRFLSSTIKGYGGNRERPAVAGTSMLSPYLANGEITPYQIWHALKDKRRHLPEADTDTFRRELMWREFCHHLLFHAADLARENFDRKFDAFPWRRDRKALRVWQRGETGYPIVDAGLRQLWQTGWMHNRVRMIVASFLVKHLLIDWREGEQWFWDTLVDADPADNPGNWQWVAGSGADASPYFRVFNPTLQGKKFDPDGAYVRRFVPELDNLPARFIHEPWKAPREVLQESDITLGKTYPEPIVAHDEGRQRALDALGKMRARAG